MSRVTHVRSKGEDVSVKDLGRLTMKLMKPKAYRALEESDHHIPPVFYVDEALRQFFFVDSGLVPVIYGWIGKRWTKVKS